MAHVAALTFGCNIACMASVLGVKGGPLEECVPPPPSMAGRGRTKLAGKTPQAGRRRRAGPMRAFLSMMARRICGGEEGGRASAGAGGGALAASKVLQGAPARVAVQHSKLEQAGSSPSHPPPSQASRRASPSQAPSPIPFPHRAALAHAGGHAAQHAHALLARLVEVGACGGRHSAEVGTPVSKGSPHPHPSCPSMALDARHTTKKAMQGPGCAAASAVSPGGSPIITAPSMHRVPGPLALNAGSVHMAHPSSWCPRWCSPR
jgi:hypothetical protein